MKFRNCFLLFIAAISIAHSASASKNMRDATYLNWRNRIVPDLLNRLRNANNNDAVALEQELNTLFARLNAQEAPRVRAIAPLYQEFLDIITARNLPAPAALPLVPIDPELIAPEDRPAPIAPGRVIPYSPALPPIPAAPQPAPQPLPSAPELEEPTPPASPSAKPSREESVSSKDKNEEAHEIPELPGQQQPTPRAIPQPAPQPLPSAPVNKDDESKVLKDNKEIDAAFKDAQDTIKVLGKYDAKNSLSDTERDAFAQELDAADRAGGKYLNLVGAAEQLDLPAVQRNRTWIMNQLQAYNDLYEKLTAPANVAQRQPAMPMAKTDLELRVETLNRIIADANKLLTEPATQKIFNKATKVSKRLEDYLDQAREEKRKNILIALKKTAVDAIHQAEKHDLISKEVFEKQIGRVVKIIVDLATNLRDSLQALAANSGGSKTINQQLAQQDLKEDKVRRWSLQSLSDALKDLNSTFYLRTRFAPNSASGLVAQIKVLIDALLDSDDLIEASKSIMNAQEQAQYLAQWKPIKEEISNIDSLYSVAAKKEANIADISKMPESIKILDQIKTLIKKIDPIFTELFNWLTKNMNK